MALFFQHGLKPRRQGLKLRRLGSRRERRAGRKIDQNRRREHRPLKPGPATNPERLIAADISGRQAQRQNSRENHNGKDDSSHLTTSFGFNPRCTHSARRTRIIARMNKANSAADATLDSIQSQAQLSNPLLQSFYQEEILERAPRSEER